MNDMKNKMYYLVKKKTSDDTYMKIKQLAEDLRAMAMRNECAIITATQVNFNFLS